jgi:hypothetical protein
VSCAGAKKRTSRYRSGERGWVKVKRQEFVAALRGPRRQSRATARLPLAANPSSRDTSADAPEELGRSAPVGRRLVRLSVFPHKRESGGTCPTPKAVEVLAKAARANHDGLISRVNLASHVSRVSQVSQVNRISRTAGATEHLAQPFGMLPWLGPDFDVWDRGSGVEHRSTGAPEHRSTGLRGSCLRRPARRHSVRPRTHRARG